VHDSFVCVSSPKSASFPAESEFSVRGAAEVRQKALFTLHYIKFFRQPHELQSKRRHWKITNLLGIYLFQIDTF
jgi:hypothetical protein